MKGIEGFDACYVIVRANLDATLRLWYRAVALESIACMCALSLAKFTPYASTLTFADKRKPGAYACVHFGRKSS